MNAEHDPDLDRDLTGQPQAGQVVRPGPMALNRPMRWLVAAGEVLAAAGLMVLVVLAWRRASIPVQLPEVDNPAIPDFVGRTSGPWTATAVVTATIAGALLLDALREALLASRPRSHQPSTQHTHAPGGTSGAPAGAPVALGEAPEDVESPH